MNRTLCTLAALAFLPGLFACGGGGGNATPPVTPPQDDVALVFTAIATGISSPTTITHAGNVWEQTLLDQTPYSISAFGEDETGRLYVADYATGTIYRLDLQSGTGSGE